MATQKRGAQAPQLVLKALVNLLGAADRVKGLLAEVVEPYDITAQQYNVLRILRGAGAQGLPTLTIAERMMERSPGVTRMIDRLEAKGLVGRERGSDDRRCVYCRITPIGLQLLDELDAPIAKADIAAFAALNRNELRTLVTLLERIRQSHDSAA